MLTQERLKSLIHYNPETGVFTWLVRRGGKALAGSVAGSITDQGYVLIRVDRHNWKAHRLAWLYMTGEQPPRLLDHKNCNRIDNRWSNIRRMDPSGNSQNVRAANRDSWTGYLGVTVDKRNGRYVAQIVKDGKNHYIGRFSTAEEAHAAYLEVKRVLHPATTL